MLPDDCALPRRERPAICYVAPAFPVLSETFVANEMRAVRALGHPVLAVALAPHTGACQPEDEPLRAQTVLAGSIPAPGAVAAVLAAAFPAPARLARALAFARAQRGIRPRSLLLAGARIALAARRAGCTHFHAHFAQASAAAGIVAARLLGGTCSFTGHGYDVYGAPSDLAVKLLAADFAVAVCADMAEEFRRLAPGARIELVHCGVDPSRFVPRPGPSNGRLLAVGRLCAQKGWPVLLDALASLPPAARPRVDAVGAGEMEGSLRALADRLGVADDIVFLGARPACWIAAEGPAYQGFVAPYVIAPDGRRDTGPLTVKEAMSMGLPVVASALMGLKEIVGPGCGRLVPAGDPVALARALSWLATLGAEARSAAATAARARVEACFTLAAQAGALSNLVATVARG